MQWFFCSNPSVTYAPGLSVDVPKRGQGHPLKSFSVPGPPSTQQLTSNQAKHGMNYFNLFFIYGHLTVLII